MVLGSGGILAPVNLELSPHLLYYCEDQITKMKLASKGAQVGNTVWFCGFSICSDVPMRTDTLLAVC